MKLGDVLKTIENYPIPQGWTYAELREIQRAVWASHADSLPEDKRNLGSVAYSLWQNEFPDWETFLSRAAEVVQAYPQDGSAWWWYNGLFTKLVNWVK